MCQRPQPASVAPQLWLGHRSWVASAGNQEMFTVSQPRRRTSMANCLKLALTTILSQQTLTATVLVEAYTGNLSLLGYNQQKIQIENNGIFSGKSPSNDFGFKKLSLGALLRHFQKSSSKRENYFCQILLRLLSMCLNSSAHWIWRDISHNLPASQNQLHHPVI